jgi:hypothetical protein
MENLWQQLSKEISDKVAAAGESIVAVDGRSGHTSSGIVWRPDYILYGVACHPRRGRHRGTSFFRKVRWRATRGRAHASDIALLKLETPLQTKAADLGDSSSLAVGALVVAVGRTRRGNVVASSGVLSGLMGEWRSGAPASINSSVRTSPCIRAFPEAR